MSTELDYSYLPTEPPCEWHVNAYDALAAQQPPMPEQWPHEQRKADMHKRAAWRILQANAELRQRVQELGLTNEYAQANTASAVETIGILRQRIAELEAQIAATWQPAPDEMRHENGTSLVYDEIAVTMAHDNTAKATMQWPDDGYVYAVCRARPANDPAQAERSEG